jgi:hypothetical protein
MSWKSKEEALFEHIKEAYISDLEWSDGSYSHYDCYSINHKCEIELKCRNTHYDELVIEKAKYDKLIERATEHKTLAVYVCQTPKGIYAFNLTKMDEPNWVSKGMPKTSHFSQRQFIEKIVGFLDVADAKYYE